MKTLSKFIASVAAFSCIFVAGSAHAMIVVNPSKASLARCGEVAGREKARCLLIHNRTKRLRLRSRGKEVSHKAVTLRQLRILARQQNHNDNSVKRIRGFKMNRLKTHNRNGGNARRLINHRDETARAACKDVPREDKSECIRQQWGALRKGNTR